MATTLKLLFMLITHVTKTALQKIQWKHQHILKATDCVTITLFPTWL